MQIFLATYMFLRKIIRSVWVKAEAKALELEVTNLTVAAEEKLQLYQSLHYHCVAILVGSLPFIFPLLLAGPSYVALG